MTQEPGSFKRLCMALLATTFLLPHVQAVDSVTRRSDNRTLRGEITKVDTASIVLKRTNGEEVTVSVADLKAVQFEGEPSTLAQARTNERSGALDDALAKLQESQKSFSGASKYAKTDLEFLVARVIGKQALIDPSKTTDALKALQTFRTANKTNFRYLEATLLQAAVHAQQKQIEEGKTLLAEVKASPVKGFQLQAGVALGRLLLASGDAASAQQSFEDVIQKCKGDASASGAMYDGMLGRALCQKEQGNVDEAIATLDEVIAKVSAAETRTLAEAWVRKGDCYRQKNAAKAALMAYLHVDVLYSGESAQHAEALLRLSQLWGPTGHEDRAMEASARLADRYPNSSWAKQSTTGG